METGATTNFRQRLKSTLLDKTGPEFPMKSDWILELRSNTAARHEGGEVIGTLPIRLQHLLMLAVHLEEEFNAEYHRRCVDFFGEEDYDNEGIEFMIHTELDRDSRFNRAASVWNMLERRIRRNWHTQLTTTDGHEVIYFIDARFHVYATQYQKKTSEEWRVEFENNVQALEDALGNLSAAH